MKVLCQDGCGGVEIATLTPSANDPPGTCSCGGQTCCCSGCLAELMPDASNEALRAASEAAWSEARALGKDLSR